MSLTSPPSRLRRVQTVGVAAAALGLVLAGCANPEKQASAPAGEGPAATAAAQTGDAGPTCTLQATGYPKVDLATAKVGFSQSEKEGNPFRIAETQSIRDEAAKLGIPPERLLVTNAQSDLNKQISDVKSMLAQGAQVIIIAPLNSDGLQPALDAAKEKKVPVITVDRRVNSQPCTDYLTFIGSNFVDQGKRAAEEMARITGGTGKIAILLGASGNNVTTDRTKGFKDELAKTPGLQVIAEQTGEFERAKGQAVMEQLIQSNPDITAVYAENDEMGLGAINALKAAGKTPGKDVKIVSIDGTRNAVQQIADGNYNAVIESNPRFGPLAFETVKKFENGEPIPATVIISDDAYNESNAAQKVGNAY